MPTLAPPRRDGRDRGRSRSVPRRSSRATCETVRPSAARGRPVHPGSKPATSVTVRPETWVTVRPMPWAQTDPMSERLRFVLARASTSPPSASLCAAFGVAPKTGYKWLHQFEADGPRGLRTAPAGPRATAAPSPGGRASGWSSCAASMRPGAQEARRVARASERAWDVPAAEHGRRAAEAAWPGESAQAAHAQQHPRTEPLRHADKPNAVWSMDFKGWFRLGDGTRCDPLTVTDAFSRYLLCCKAGTLGGRRCWPARSGPSWCGRSASTGCRTPFESTTVSPGQRPRASSASRSSR